MSLLKRRVSAAEYENAGIQRVMSEGKERVIKTVTRGTEKNIITLSPMKSLSVEDFTYPFPSTAKIRDALRLQTLPYSAGGEVEIFPVTMSKTGRKTSGIVWYVSPEELEIPVQAQKIWPAPLPFVSGLKEYGGDGITIWADEENISSILWQSNHPVLYRWQKKTDEGGIKRISEWYDRYCEARGMRRGGDYVINASGGDEAAYKMPLIISESVKICPWIAEVNLSRKVLEGARDLERTVRMMSRIAIWLLMSGAVILGADIADIHNLRAEVNETRERSERIYRETFDPQRTGRISNPVTLARDKIASYTGKGEEGRQLDEVLAEMGEIYGVFKDSGMTIDIIRYNAEGIDCSGTAPDMTTVLNFRHSWEEKAKLVQVDNTQFVSGIGYRFDIRIRW